MFLDPRDLTPFFAGTYFPLERRYGMPAFRELLQAIHQWFGENRDDLGDQSARLRAALESMQAAPEAPEDRVAALVQLRQLGEPLLPSFFVRS